MSSQSPIGTRYRNGTVKGGFGLNSLRKVNRTTTDVGGLNTQNTNISFTAPATVTGVGLPVFTAGSLIQIMGSPLNSTSWEVATSNSTTITMTVGQIVTESAGAFIDIRTV